MKYLLSILCFSACYLSNIAAAESDISRIAVAGGSITEIIYRLNEEHRIVGVDSTSQYPEVATQHPLLGYVRNVSAEGVLSLKPDLLIGEADTGPTKIVHQIRAAGIKTAIISEDDTLAAIKNKIRLVAELLNVEQKGKALLDDIQVDIDALNFAREKITTSPRILFLLSANNGTPMAAGHNTSAHTTIIESGATNVLAHYKGWQKLSPESTVALNPDIIIVMDRGKEALESIKQLPHFKYSNAAKNNAFISVNGNYLLGFGPRTPQAIVELGTMIHPSFPLPKNYTFRQPNSAGTIAEGHR